MVKFNLIVAYDSLYGIGHDGKLSWDFNANSTTRNDLLNFKRLTANHIVVMGNNTWKSMDRTTTGTISIFGCNPIHFDISNSVPLLTTKKMGYRGIIKKLLWFLHGDMDAKILEQQNVYIWNRNTSREYLDKLGLTNYKPGILGPGYGWSWRHYNADYDQELADSSKVNDKQFGLIKSNTIEHLLKTDPFSRRIFLTSWNPSVLDQVALPPCHVSAQFYVSKNVLASCMELSCHVYMRSNDTFLGCPYNIFSYTVLVYILAVKCNMKPKELIISFGDAHVYTNHLLQINTQLNRKILNPPQLNVSIDVATKDYSELTINDFEIINYQYHPSLGAVMSA
ncbi:thymidylate synthase/dCMP hydroxymethylase domain-containing protein [Chytriomyces cf. hyalinus JEL632]|nr:thymidylate synthase/dCMP hydroxymethylase domain-containing protein [Chytriomyces cf. hyalinus JEL632]